MAVHNCAVWTVLGINCPSALIDHAELGVELEPGEAPEPEQVTALPAHRRAKKPPPMKMSQATMAILMEIWRRSQVKALAGAQKVAGEAFPPAKIPVEFMREAIAQGARGRELSLWVAAAAASLAIGVRLGPSAVQLVPKMLLEGLRGMPGGRGGGGLHFNASRRVRTLLEGGTLRKLAGGLVSGGLDLGGSFGFDADP